MKKEDYMRLPKECLAEMLEERDKLDQEALERFKEVIGKNLSPSSVQSNPKSCFEGGPCTNPFHDCINCPRQFGGYGNTVTSTNTNIGSHE